MVARTCTQSLNPWAHHREVGHADDESQHMATIIHHQVWGVATSGIGGALRLPDGRSRALERNQTTLTKRNDFVGRSSWTHFRINGAAA